MPVFEEANRYEGERPGRVFKQDVLGLGYYLDGVPVESTSHAPAPPEQVDYTPCAYVCVCARTRVCVCVCVCVYVYVCVCVCLCVSVGLCVLCECVCVQCVRGACVCVCGLGRNQYASRNPRGEPLPCLEPQQVIKISE